MMNKIKETVQVRKVFSLALALVLFFNTTVVFAVYFDYGFKDLNLTSGFMKAKIREKKEYQGIPFLYRFGFDLRPALKNKSDCLLEFVVEPFTNIVVKPKSNLESGCNFVFKFAPKLTARLYPYVEGGIGMIYLTMQTREQSTRFNFNEVVGGGITYFLKKNIALNLGYRYRHLSNAGIKKPNKGIETAMCLAGISLFY